MEWLSTGEMIDRLKVGEVAQDISMEEAEVFVKKEKDHTIMYCHEDGAVNKGFGTHDGVFVMNGPIIQHSKWRILPRFVSFGEAMEALKEGKFIQFHSKKNTSLRAHKYSQVDWFKNCSWDELLIGKWTIEEDSQ